MAVNKAHCMRIRIESYQGPEHLYFEAIREGTNRQGTEVVSWGKLTRAELFELHAALGDFLLTAGLQAAADSMDGSRA